MASKSLTVQAGVLMAGRMLAMPLAFLVPIILVRLLSVEEFGYYKQAFLIFNVALPIIDLGITNSLYYFIPRFAKFADIVVSQTLLITSVICCIFAIIFFAFSSSISVLFTGDYLLAPLMPLIGIFAILWHMSNILEVILVVEKKAFTASIVNFLSELGRSGASILAVLADGGLKDILYGLIFVGVIKVVVMGRYLFAQYNISLSINIEMVRRLLLNSLPFGIAVVLNGFVANIHLYIVSVTLSSEEFALFSIGCFQLPFIGVTIDSIAKTSMVRMAEMRAEDSCNDEIASIISNSCRKLWLVFFPIFIFLLICAKEIVIILFTDQYIESVGVLRIFLFIIPISAILVQHVPRVFEKTNLILFNNIISLINSALLCFAGAYYLGLKGAALGYVLSQLFWKTIFLYICRKLLNVGYNNFFPFMQLAKISIVFCVIGLICVFIKNNLELSATANLICMAAVYLLMSLLAFLKGNLLLDSEKAKISGLSGQICRRFMQ